MATIKEVARRAGVSITTVSHVVNGTRFVAEATRQRVLAAVGELGYAPNMLARSLVTSKTATLGLAISAFSNVYTAELCSALERRCFDAGLTLLVAETHDDQDRELAVVGSLQQRRVDGIFLATAAGADNPTLEHLRRSGLPTVLVDRIAAPDFDAVGVENRDSTAGLVRHLASAGHRRIGMIAGRAGVSTTEERRAGYRLGLETADLPFDPSLEQDGQSSSRAAETAMGALLDLETPPTAVISGNNAMTLGSLRSLNQRALDVPGDIALAVFDDFEWADLLSPQLTALAQPIEQIGDQAIRLMLSRLADSSRPAEHRRIPPELHHRQSCGCGSAG